MSGFFYFIISPLLLLVSIQLTIFATLTTTLAFSTLFFRALLVYAELAAALIQDQFSGHTPSKSTTFSDKTIDEEKCSRRKSRRGSIVSGSSNGGSITPKAPETTGFGVYSGGGVSRDFEGVGGWRIPQSDGEDELWISLNSRLELPTVGDERRRNHHRARTSGSFGTYGPFTKGPGHSRAGTPTGSIYAARSNSPEEYFAYPTISKSTIALDTANIGKTLLRHKPSSSSSGSSQGSTHAMHLTLSNT